MPVKTKSYNLDSVSAEVSKLERSLQGFTNTIWNSKLVSLKWEWVADQIMIIDIDCQYQTAWKLDIGIKFIQWHV